MAICIKCGKVLLRPERGNIRSSLEEDGFEHKNCSTATGPFPNNPVVDLPKPIPIPTALPVVREPEEKEEKRRPYPFTDSEHSKYREI